jgi:N6-adenosine-specific RNA methylase IME4
MKSITAKPHTIRIADIKIGKRHRKDLGDIEPLSASISEVGLLHPIVIRPDRKLIAGARRLRACKSLGWTEVPVTIVPLDKIVRGEFAENIYREDFLPSEAVAIKRALEPVERALAKKRQGTRTDKHPGRLPTSSKGRAGDKAAKAVGMSRRTLEKAEAVVVAAEANPEKFGHLMEELDRPHGVDGAYYKLKRMQDEQRVLNISPRQGKYRTLVVDPPWPTDNDGAVFGRWRPPYALADRDACLALPIGQWADDNCILWLWTTNTSMPLGFECVERWGFTYKGILTWLKPSIKLGQYLRGQTEHCIFAIRGKPKLRSRSISTALVGSTYFEGATTAHSEKPEEFYDLVRAGCFPPFGEAFQRKARDGFVNLYQAARAAA